MYVVFFALGFVALAGLWAVAGSLASRQEDLQSTTMPGQVLLFAPYIIAFSAGAGVKTVVSMLPIMSAMLMPSRMAEGGVPVWQIAVAVVGQRRRRGADRPARGAALRADADAHRAQDRLRGGAQLSE